MPPIKHCTAPSSASTPPAKSTANRPAQNARRKRNASGFHSGIERIKEKFSEVNNSRVINTSQQRRPIVLVALNKTEPGQGTEFIQNFFKDDALQSVGVLLVLEAHVDLKTPRRSFGNCSTISIPNGISIIAGQRIGIDVTRKLAEEGYQQNWPEEIVMSEEIIQKVDQKWHQLI